MTIGQLFQSKRLESGRSIEQLAALTKIHIKILTAIEADDYTDLPARAFTRGFIVNYAKALKLNPDEVVKEYHEFLEQKFSERLDRDKGHQGYVFEGKEIEQTRRWMVIGASVAILFAGATLFIFKPQNHRHKEQHKEFEEEVSSLQAVTPTSTPNFVPLNGAVVSSSASASPSPAILSVIANVKSTPVLVSSPKPTDTPKATVSPAPTFAPSIMPSTSLIAPADATATPTPSPTPVREDKLNKGDDLDAKTAKMKITFEAQEDVWVRYKIDNKPFNTLILRKGRFLAIKATQHLYYETPHAENLKYKIRGSYTPLEVVKGEVGANASIKSYEGDALGNGIFPEEVPPPRR